MTYVPKDLTPDSIDPSVLEEQSRVPNRYVRQAVAENIHASQGTLKRMSADENEHPKVRAAADQTLAAQSQARKPKAL